MYKLLRNSTSILRVADGACIPASDDNDDYQAYLRWRDGWTESPEGGTEIVHEPHVPEAADPAPPPSKDEVDAAAAREDALVQALRARTPAEAATWVDNNVTDHASVKAALRIAFKILCILARRL